MKSSVFLILFVLIISCSNTAYDLLENKEVNNDADIEKESGDIPEVALKNFQAKYHLASSIKWGKDGDIFDVKFILDGQEYEAEFDKTGKWLETEKEIKIIDIPEAIQKVLNTEYSGYEIKDAEYADTADYGNLYEVVIQKGDKKIEIYFYPDGIILKEETVGKDNEDDNVNEGKLIF